MQMADTEILLHNVSGVRLGNCMEKYEKSLFFI